MVAANFNSNSTPLEQKHLDRIRQRAIDAAESEAPPKSKLGRSLGIAGGALAVGLLLWFFISRAIPDDPVDVGGDAEEGDQETVESDYSVVGVEDLVGEFMGAETVEELLELVDHPEETEPRLRKYFSEGGATLPLNGSVFSKFTEGTWEDRVVYFLRVRGIFADVSILPVVFTDDGPKVLWEESFGWMEPRWEELVESRPANPVTVKVFGHLDDYYNYSFLDEEEWVCINLRGGDLKVGTYAYLKRTEVDKEILKSLRFRTPVIAELKFLPNREHNQAEITRLIKVGNWLEGEGL